MTKNNQQLTLKQEQRLYELQTKKNPESFDAYKTCNNLVVFGKSGSGKSTVINSLLGHKLKAVKKPFDPHHLNIDLVDPELEPQIKISHGYVGTETLTPIQAEEITIWECPTFCENMEDEVQMIEFPRIMQLLKTLNSVKFLFVIDYVGFGSCRGQGFSDEAELVASIFDDTDVIDKSISIIITGASKDLQEKTMKENIRAIKLLHQISDNTKKMLGRFQESLHIFREPQSEGEEVEGPKLEQFSDLAFCDVSDVIQYPTLSRENQKLAIELIQEDDVRQQFEEAKIDMENIPDAWFFKKVVDFLYEALSSVPLLGKVSEYITGIFTSFSSLAGVNNFKNYFASNKMDESFERDGVLPPMSQKKIQMAKCLATILNEDRGLKEEINVKFNECITKYLSSNDDVYKKTIVKEFSDFILAKTDFKNKWQNFEVESQIVDKNYQHLEKDLSDNDYDINEKKQEPANNTSSALEEKDIRDNEIGESLSSDISTIKNQANNELTDESENEMKSSLDHKHIDEYKIEPVNNISSDFDSEQKDSEKPDSNEAEKPLSSDIATTHQEDNALQSYNQINNPLNDEKVDKYIIESMDGNSSDSESEKMDVTNELRYIKEIATTGIQIMLVDVLGNLGEDHQF